MARIGDYIQPSLNQYDPTPYLNAQGAATRTIGAGVANAVGDFGDVLKEQREKEAEIKASSKMIESYMNLYPDAAAALEPVKNALADKDSRVSDRYAVAKQSSTLIGDYLKEKDRAAQLGIQKEQLAIDDRGMDMREQDHNLAQLESGEAKQEADGFKQMVAPSVLKQIADLTAANEASGGQSVIPSQTLLNALETASPGQQLKLAELAMSYLPQAEKVELRDSPVTINGQPGTATTRYNPKTGALEIVPVVEAGGASNPGLVEFVKAQESFIPKAYDDYKQTSIGYGTRAKEGETTITKEEAEKRLLFELGQARKEVEAEATKVGIPLNPNQLDALTSFQYNTGSIGQLLQGGKRTPQQVAEAMQLYTQAGGKTLPGLVKRRKQEAEMFAMPSVTAGAAKGSAQTPAQAEKERLELAKLQGEVAGQQAAITKEKSINKAAAEDAVYSLDLISQLESHPGFEDVFGVSLGGRHVPGNDGQGADALFDQIKNRGFLEVIDKIKGTGSLSDAEGKRLLDANNRLRRGLSEEEAKTVLKEMKGLIQKHIERMGGAPGAVGVAGASAVPSESAAAKRLREIREAEAKRRAAVGTQ